MEKNEQEPVPEQLTKENGRGTGGTHYQTNTRTPPNVIPASNSMAVAQ